MINNLKEEIDYTNISFINYESNLLQIINSYSNIKYKTITDRLNDIKIKQGFNISNINNSVKNIFKNMLLYNNHKYTVGTGYCNKIIRSIIKDFIYLYSTDKLKKVIKFHYKKKKCTDDRTGRISYTNYIIYNFNIRNLYKYSKSDPAFIKSEILDYVGAFYHYSILYFVLSFIYLDDIEENKLNNFFKEVSEQACRGLFSGFEATAEYSLNCSYGALYEELFQLKPKDEAVLHITKNPDKQAIEFKIHNNNIFCNRYKNHEGYSFSNKPFFGKSYSKFRIVKGSTTNSVKFVLNKASGDETIQWLFRVGHDEFKTHPDTLYNDLMENPTNMIKFAFLSIIDATDYLTADIKTNYNSYYNFIKKYTGKRYVPERIAVIILLATHPELQEEIESKFLTNKQQRTDLMKDVRKLRKLLRKEPISFLKDFINMVTRRSNYVW